MLLGNTEDVVHEPVNYEPGRKAQEHEGEYDRHHHHHLCLLRVHCGRRHLLLEYHCGPHDNRQYVIRVLYRKVRYPENERRTPEFNRIQENIIECDEYGYLEEHRQTSADRVYLMFLVKPHHLFLLLLGVVLVFLFYLRHHGLDRLHLLHRLLALVHDGDERDPRDDCQEDYRPAVVAEEAVKELQYPEEGHCDYGEPAEIDYMFEAHVERLQPVVFLRSGVKDEFVLLSRHF